ncbi:MAG: carbohydrate kinase family protein [Vallitaleaceae bacterium]|nr:carbohydrate kinase family protein [Vallitaleaceae bacterium]
MIEVICVGILVADVIARTVNKLPDPGKLDLVDKIELYTGGCAVNSAIDMAKLGLNVGVVGKIGNDGFGRFLSDALKVEGVNTEGLVIDQETSTSSSMVTVDKNGERSFLHCLGANAEFVLEDINYEVIDRSKIVFVGGTMLLKKFDGEQCAAFLKKTKEMDKYTVLDTAWDSTGKWMQILKPCMPYIDLFIPSIEEAVMLSGKEDPEEIADVFLGMGVKTAVIKLGKKGCFIKDSLGETQMIPAFNVENAVDTTGAGDSFVAGFLFGISKGWSLYECGVFANAVGAHCVMAAGASTGIKSYEEIMTYISNN